MNRFLVTAMLLALPAQALAWGEDQQIDGDATTYWAGYYQAASSGGCVETSSASAAVCALFPAGESQRHMDSTVIVSAITGPATCCWVGATTIVPTAMTSMLSDHTAYLSGYGNDSGPGACFRVGAAGVEVADRPRWKWLHTSASPQAGVRAGLCDVEVTTTESKTSGEGIFAPCSVDSDCTSYGAGSCDTSPSSSLTDRAGMFLTCTPDGDTTPDTTVFVRKQRVGR